jgi:hypothetical protein
MTTYQISSLVRSLETQIGSPLTDLPGPNVIDDASLAKILRQACSEIRPDNVFEPQSIDIMSRIAEHYNAGDAALKARIDNACGGSFFEFARHAEPQHWKELTAKLELKSE